MEVRQRLENFIHCQMSGLLIMEYNCLVVSALSRYRGLLIHCLPLDLVYDQIARHGEVSICHPDEHRSSPILWEIGAK